MSEEGRGPWSAHFTEDEKRPRVYVQGEQGVRLYVVGDFANKLQTFAYAIAIAERLNEWEVDRGYR